MHEAFCAKLHHRHCDPKKHLETFHTAVFSPLLPQRYWSLLPSAFQAPQSTHRKAFALHISQLFLLILFLNPLSASQMPFSLAEHQDNDLCQERQLARRSIFSHSQRTICASLAKRVLLPILVVNLANPNLGVGGQWVPHSDPFTVREQ